MAFGVQLFNAAGVELVGRFVPSFIVDNITSPASGSRSYVGVTGKTLNVYLLNYITVTAAPGAVQPATATVSGNTVTWSGVSNEQPVMVVYE